MESLEKKLEEAFKKNVKVKIPENARKTIVEWSPWINLVFGVLGLLSSWYLWQAAHRVSTLIDAINGSVYSDLYGVAPPVASLGIIFWVSLLSLIVSSVIMLASVPGLKERSLSKGWRLAFYGVLLNMVYAVVFLFADQSGAFSRFIWALIVTTLSLYVLFQIKGHFSDKKSTKSEK